MRLTAGVKSIILDIEPSKWQKTFGMYYTTDSVYILSVFREQLLTDATKSGLSSSSRVSSQDEIDHAIVEAILSGLFMNAAKYAQAC